MSDARYRFDGTVRRMDTYGDRYVSSTQASIVAETVEEATEKARTAFGASYDKFRKFWSHRFLVESVTEVDTTEAEPSNTEGKP